MPSFSFLLFLTVIAALTLPTHQSFSTFIDKYFSSDCGSGLEAHYIDCYFTLDGAQSFILNFGFEADYRLERRNERNDVEGVYYSNAF